MHEITCLGYLTKVIDKFFVTFALDINVNMKMYSIAVAVNLDHSGKCGFSLEHIWVFFNHTREFMHCDHRAVIIAQFSCVGMELQYNVCDTVEVVFF